MCTGIEFNPDNIRIYIHSTFQVAARMYLLLNMADVDLDYKMIKITIITAWSWEMIVSSMLRTDYINDHHKTCI